VVEIGSLSAVDLRKSFGGVHALRGVSIDFKRGSIHALLGANGAGKSTLIAICTGSLAPDHGQVELDGSPLHLPDPRHAQGHGIAVVHQEPEVMPSLSVAQNLAIEEVGSMKLLQTASTTHIREIAQAKLDRLGLNLPLDARLGQLPVSSSQLVDIARALSGNPRILFLDEPNSSLSHAETDTLLGACRSMADQGCAVVFVTHRLREVFSIANHATVLRDGEVVWSGDAPDLTIPEAVSMMASPGSASQIRISTNKKPESERSTTITLDRLSRKGQYRDVSMRVSNGEVLGVSGLIGSGRTELISSIAGLTRATTGSIAFGSLTKRFWKTPAEAWLAGIALVPEDRQRDGLFMNMSVEWNMMSVCRTLGITPKTTPAEMAKSLGIKMPSLIAPVSSLSGGNQQKVILARALLTGPKILILDEPTRGVDVAAKADIYALVRQQAESGCAVILVSSELDEVIELSDRIVVMRQGQIVKEFGPNPSSSELVAAAFGEAA
jgi:ABC-type sugar transport system ATPase subunit